MLLARTQRRARSGYRVHERPRQGWRASSTSRCSRRSSAGSRARGEAAVQQCATRSREPREHGFAHRAWASGSAGHPGLVHQARAHRALQVGGQLVVADIAGAARSASRTPPRPPPRPPRRCAHDRAPDEPASITGPRRGAPRARRRHELGRLKLGGDSRGGGRAPPRTVDCRRPARRRRELARRLRSSHAAATHRPPARTGRRV